MSGGGAAFDGTRAYASTGNNVDCPQQPPCPSFPPLALSNSLLQVNPYGAQNLGLGQISQFQPPQASSWVNGDADLGSSRVIVVPGTNYVLVGGKAGNIYILDRTSLTGGSLMATFHVGAGNTSSIGPIISGGLAYWNRTIYTWSGYDTLRSFSLDSALLNSLPSQNPPSNPPNNEQGSALSVSSNFDTNGLLWTVVPSGEHNDAAGGHIQAYDLSNFNQALWSHDLNGEEIMKFIAPVVANGKVYVTTNGSKATMPLTPPHLLVYGLP